MNIPIKMTRERVPYIWGRWKKNFKELKMNNFKVLSFFKKIDEWKKIKTVIRIKNE